VIGKAGLLTLIGLILLYPDWGNLEGKSPTARAVTYPAVAFAIPVWWHLREQAGHYPWVADLLLTLTGFSDVLGNRLDLYDKVFWFDDWMHFMNSGLVAAAALLLMREWDVGLAVSVERAVAVGVTASLGWELFEYLTFMTGSREYPMAYVDTLGDLSLGWAGAFVAGVVVSVVRGAVGATPAPAGSTRRRATPRVTPPPL
jgi:hypothetical protein